jgi:hypothetical protein
VIFSPVLPTKRIIGHHNVNLAKLCALSVLITAPLCAIIANTLSEFKVSELLPSVQRNELLASMLDQDHKATE